MQKADHSTRERPSNISPERLGAITAVVVLTLLLLFLIAGLVVTLLVLDVGHEAATLIALALLSGVAATVHRLAAGWVTGRVRR
jgi:hypothetical protein